MKNQKQETIITTKDCTEIKVELDVQCFLYLKIDNGSPTLLEKKEAKLSKIEDAELNEANCDNKIKSLESDISILKRENEELRYYWVADNKRAERLERENERLRKENECLMKDNEEIMKASRSKVFLLNDDIVAKETALLMANGLLGKLSKENESLKSELSITRHDLRRLESNISVAHENFTLISKERDSLKSELSKLKEIHEEYLSKAGCTAEELVKQIDQLNGQIIKERMRAEEYLHAIRLLNKDLHSNDGGQINLERLLKRVRLGEAF